MLKSESEGRPLVRYSKTRDALQAALFTGTRRIIRIISSDARHFDEFLSFAIRLLKTAAHSLKCD